MGKTSIEWTDYAWPVAVGCTRISEGCRNCYAERLAATRLVHVQRYKGLASMTPSGPRWHGDARLAHEALAAPLRLRKTQRIFVAEMGDLFHHSIPDHEIDRVFGVMWAALYSRDGNDGHVFQVLTKRAERMADYLKGRGLFARWAQLAGAITGDDVIYDQTLREAVLRPHPRIWLGVSVESQEAADARIPLLLSTPAAVRWISAEPLLGPLDLSDYLSAAGQCEWGGPKIPHRGLDWVVVGGESGPCARPCNVEWIESVVEQCQAASVPVFVKQLGADAWAGRRQRLTLRDRKGGNPAEWPGHLRVREFLGGAE